MEDWALVDETLWIVLIGVNFGSRCIVVAWFSYARCLRIAVLLMVCDIIMNSSTICVYCHDMTALLLWWYLYVAFRYARFGVGCGR